MRASADVAGELRAARAEQQRAEDAATRSATLSGEEACPVCGQELGQAFEQVQAHRRDEVEAARERVAGLERLAAEAATQQATATKALDAAQAALAAARTAWVAWQEQATRRASAEEALTAALARLDRPPADGELAALASEVEAGTKAAAELARLEGRLERAGAVEVELASLTAKVATLAEDADKLRVRVRDLGFDAGWLAKARTARDSARTEAELLARRAEDARVVAAKAGAALDAAKERLADGEARHADIQTMVDEVRHTSRVADLLGEFRNTVVQSVGPLLAHQAADLFAELTDHEYDTLNVNPETYEIQITDAGVEHGLARFSGSETDLANLALRIAISEHVRLQSGGQVGLLVLDEVFGPLDPDRKERMLLALERLKARFRQVMVITHDEAIKEQLPSAIEVVKLPGRRATARVI
jgi:DNA repair exonuclease SbcCD ATPase subunit